ncbi:COR domain-containing protein [Sphingobacterium detergens]|uniref:leucine-rich repeat domain-containing protein n=1 Tax=Sphingobacterium detergens TaxID=1145106 RepID=UPI003AAA5659
MNIVKRNLYIVGDSGKSKTFLRKILEEIMLLKNKYHDDRILATDWVIDTHNNISFEVDIKDYSEFGLRTLQKSTIAHNIVIYAIDVLGRDVAQLSDKAINMLKHYEDEATVIVAYSLAEGASKRAVDRLRDRLSFIEYFIPLDFTSNYDDYRYLNEFSLVLRQIIINSHHASLLYARQLIKKNFETRDPTLDLGNCGLTSLKGLTELFESTHLRKLILSNEWGEYDGSDLKRQTSKNIFDPNILFAFPKELNRLHNLEVLIAGGNWSDAYKKSKNYFSRWYINDITPLTELTTIKTLNLSNNGIRTVGPLAKLRNLNELYLNNNQIDYFPDISNFPNLTVLYLSNNKIYNVEFLSDGSSLKLVDLHSNQISDLTPITDLIEKIDIADSKWESNIISIAKNPLSVPPAEVVAKGRNHVLAYFNKLEAEKEIKLNPYLNSDIKLILVGNSNVGKSTFVEWLKTNKVNTGLATTHWMDFGVWKTSRNGKNYTIRIFDFGGQEYYHETHHLFFTNRTAYALLWESNSNDFGEVVVDQKQRDGSTKEVAIETFPLEYWLDSIRYHTQKRQQVQTAKTVKEILIERNDHISVFYNFNMMSGRGIQEALISENHKHDAGDQQEEENILILQNKVASIKDKLFLDEANLKASYPKIYDFEEISLYSNRKLPIAKNILFDIFDSLEILNRQYLGTWNYIKQDIEASNFQNSFSIDDFHSYCNTVIRGLSELKGRSKKQQNKVLFSKEDATVFASFLSDIGLCLYYPENDQLKDKIFLNQAKILKDLNTVLLEVDRKNGEISKHAIARTLGATTTSNEINEVIGLMLHFKILFKHPLAAKRSYIAPLYLPVEPPKSIKLFEDLFEKPVYRFKYKTFIHKSIILDFFQEYGARTLSETSDDGSFYYWKNGIVVKHENCNDIVMVKFVPWNRDGECALLDIYAIKGTEEKFVNEIVDYIDSINNGLKVSKFVPGESGNEFIPLEVIHENEKNENAVFHFESKYYKLANFRKYLKSPLKMKKLFISYSKQDLALVNKFIEHLSALQRDGKVSHWYCSALEAGSDWNDEIQRHFDEADIACFMVSPSFMKTQYIHEHEIKKAFERKKVDGNFKIVPIILNFCRWTTATNNLGDYTALPYTAKPIMDFNNQDMAWYITEECLRSMIDNDLDPRGDDFYRRNLPADILKIYERIVAGKVDNNSHQK